MHLAFAFLIVAQPPADLRERERHPVAPSLPMLTKDESAQVEKIIDRFIQYDIGKLQGEAGKKALDDFGRLGPEATFELIDGLNRSANLVENCPVVVIARKLNGIFTATEDTELLRFARENIGAGVTVNRHQNVLRDLQSLCLLRRATLDRRVAAQGGRKSANVMTLAELEKSASKESGANLQAVLTEVQRRPGIKATELLASAARNADADIAKVGQSLLAKNVGRQPADSLKKLLRHKASAIRIAAARAVAARKLPLGAELIALVTDSDVAVSQAGRRALVQLSGGLDHGPADGAGFDEREAAARRWREWWSRQKR